MKANELLPDHVDSREINGVVVRKGTVGAFLINAKVWLDSSSDSTQHQQAERDMVESLPALRALGFLDVFAARDPALQKLIDSV
ncbi:MULTISPECIES: hypothetical protein [Pseudomonas]|jgi:hypothetical protein|uniref:hypothetical protein n=1 Tax=Pseudomonas TaxID=286 RepID=UPI0021CA48A0|nr:hypothetical protein [Pseudomonas sp. 13B_3.2_Bac1]MCU1773679.1 hypothetical protein [Pseudomonas sp. 13B_3.2_Bac1]